jgi:uncharacterized protein involved in exopolysaccharide biosynthesis
MPDVVPITEPDSEPLTLALWTAGVLNRWRTVLFWVVATAVLAVLAALVLPPSYRVEVSFAPNPSSSSKLGGALSSLGSGALSGLASGMGLGSVGGEPTESPAFYGELMQSRELLTRLLLTRFPDPRTSDPSDSARLVDIMKLHSNDPRRRIEMGLKSLQKSMVITSDVRTNLVKVVVSDRYPAIAASEANESLRLVNAFNLQQRTSRARGKRVYMQTRMGDARNELSRAQAAYRDFLVRNRQWHTSPTLSSDEETLRRNEDVAADLYLTVEKEYESARIDEFNDAALITIVDSAVAPVKPNWPRYSLLLPSALLFGLFLGVMIAGVSTVYADWSRRDPAAARQLRMAILRRKPHPESPTVARRA